ncbi:MAG: LLM class flavin-dependent oxidoreductase [bacterium]
MPTEYIWALCSHRAGDGRQVNQKEPERPPTLEYLTRVTQAAEDAGFANILVPCGTHCLDAWATAAAIATHVRRIKFLVAFRPGITGPVYAAQQANSLDHLTGGRLTLNVVTGSTPVDQKRYGDHLAHAERYERTEEFLDIVKRVWEESGPVTYKGKFFEIEGASIFPPRVTRPNPPIFLAGSSEPGKRVAARFADVHVMYAAEPEVVARDIEEVRRLAAQHPRERPLEFGIRHLVCVRETKEEARRAAEALVELSDIESTATWADMKLRTDSVGQRRINEMASGESLWVTDSIWMGVNQVRAGAGTMFVGTPETVAGVICEYAQAGVNHFIMNGWPHLEEAEIFGREVMPLLADTDPVVPGEPAEPAAAGG